MSPSYICILYVLINKAKFAKIGYAYREFLFSILVLEPFSNYPRLGPCDYMENSIKSTHLND